MKINWKGILIKKKKTYCRKKISELEKQQQDLYKKNREEKKFLKRTELQ